MLLRHYILIAASWLVLLPNSLANAQFNRVDEIVTRIEQRLFDRIGAVPSPKSISDFKESEIHYSLLEPLTWELEKLDLQLRLIEERRVDTQRKLERAREELLESEIHLLKRGVVATEDLHNILRNANEIAERRNLAEAEAEALARAAKEEPAEGSRKEFDRESARIKLESQRALLEEKEAAIERSQRGLDEGRIPRAEWLRSKADFETQRAAVQLAELELRASEQATASPEITEELRKAIALSEALAMRSKQINEKVSQLPELRQQLLSKEFRMRELQAASEQLIELNNKIDSLSIDRAFLASVRDRYQDGLEKTKQETAAAEEKEKSKD